jgi:hypothetical protein
MRKLKKCKISKYDLSIEVPPFLTIQIDECEVFEDDELNDNGHCFVSEIENICNQRHYFFKFYTNSSDPQYDYEIVVE